MLEELDNNIAKCTVHRLNGREETNRLIVLLAQLLGAAEIYIFAGVDGMHFVNTGDLKLQGANVNTGFVHFKNKSTNTIPYKCLH